MQVADRNILCQHLLTVSPKVGKRLLRVTVLLRSAVASLCMLNLAVHLQHVGFDIAHRTVTASEGTVGYPDRLLPSNELAYSVKYWQPVT